MATNDVTERCRALAESQQQVIAKLQELERFQFDRRSPDHQRTSRVVHNNNTNGRGRKRTHGLLCYWCKEPGHFKRECPQKWASDQNSTPSVVIADNVALSHECDESNPVYNEPLAAGEVVQGACALPTVFLQSIINGHLCECLLDTGTSISIFPGTLLHE